MGVWDELLAHVRETETLVGAVSLLSWDQQTKLPPAAAGTRGAQLGLLAVEGELLVRVELARLGRAASGEGLGQC